MCNLLGKCRCRYCRNLFSENCLISYSYTKILKFIVFVPTDGHEYQGNEIELRNKNTPVG
jgi:hypothetical protein